MDESFVIYINGVAYWLYPELPIVIDEYCDE